ncbi:MAG: carbohydrate kinase family protein, partial [Verrucomicrobiales bacterium]|nr:carbohydrate kinase family protein [Verrucomicrobiales bacterium]
MPKPEPQPDTPRHGLLAAGNFIIDHVKTIDAFPEQDMLVNITADTASNGGGPYNVLKDLSELGAPFPLAAAGLVGNDPAGDTILTDLSTHGIDTTAVLRTADAPTSYTDAMTVASTGRRTFFHHRGTNALLGTTHLVPELETSTARLFYLGYLMLLDNLDAIQPDKTTNAATVLAHASSLGFTTVADLVSIDHPDFAASVRPSLPHTDLLFLNEREA